MNGVRNRIMDLEGVLAPKIDWKSMNLPERWNKFHSHVELIFKGPLHDKDQENKKVCYSSFN